MAMTNAERQALWREQRKHREFENVGDWQLFRRAAAPMIKGLIAEGKKRTDGIMPAVVLVNAGQLQKLIDEWPDLPLETKQQMSKKRAVT